MKISLNFLCLVFLLSFLPGKNWSQHIVLNEVQSSNILLFPDEDGDYSDWIELVNNGTETVNLYNYGLTDSRSTPLKWRFPSVELNPSKHLLVFASGKDRKIFFTWRNIIVQGEDWKYRVGSFDIPATWKNHSFDDSGWVTGKSGFGYDDGDDATVLPNILSVFIRKTFSIPDTSAIVKMILHMDYDDGFVAYLNGIEIARANLGIAGIATSYAEAAKTPHEAVLYSGGVPEAFFVENFKQTIIEGQNVLCIQTHNTGVGSTDMSAIPILSVAVTGDLQIGKENPAWFDLSSGNLHTNFAIKAAGEFIGLADSSGVYLDSLEIPAIMPDESYGRYPDGQADWRFFQNPSPGLSNTDTLLRNQCGLAIFSHAGGFYPSAVTITLVPEAEGDTIYYTKDGGEPDRYSSRYTNGFSVSGSSVIRARCFASGKDPGKTVTQTYLINENIVFPVVSVSTSPYNLNDPKTGIFVYWDPYYESNLFQDWERPIHFEMFEPSKERVLNLDAGVKVAGGLTRGAPQKSLAVYSRAKYGTRSMNYQIFPQKNIQSFESIVLRNSGNDWNRTMFRDFMMQEIIRGETDLSLAAMRPSVVFLNGSYYGIANIQEKVNEHFLGANKSVNSNKVDILEYKPHNSEIQVLEGSAAGYIELMNYIETHDLSDDLNYGYVASQVDISNFIDYQISQIYIDNGDWPGNNIKWWRTNDPPGKWRWLLFDTDFGFGLDAFKTGEIQYDNNTLASALALNVGTWPNPPYSTLLFRSLMQNDGFKQQFVNRYCDHLNSTFQSQRVNEIIEKMRNTYAPEINRHYQRWSKPVSDWPVEVNVLINFSEKRSPYCYIHLLTELNLQRNNKITLSADTSMGTIKINSLHLNSFPWTGSYFPNFPVTVSALPNAGYKFVNWSDGDTLRTRSVVVTSGKQLEAFYESAATEPDVIIINEIRYISSAGLESGDWVELFNTSDATVDLSQWVLKDNDPLHEFYIPSSTFIAPRDYLIFSSDKASFHNTYPLISNYFGNLGYNLSSAGDAVRLFNAESNLIDEVVYSGELPWPKVDAENGFSIELIDPESDNSLASNWQASYLKGGTPGQQNSALVIYVQDKIIPASLLANYPNPFTSSTTIAYHLDKPTFVEIKIINLAGQVVKVLINENLAQGRHECVWDGTNEAGKRVEGGMYFYSMTSENFRQTQKLILLKR